MVSTRSGAGDSEPNISQNQISPGAMDQLLATQISVLNQLANVVANLQDQTNQDPPPPTTNRHDEFMRHEPPTYSHSAEPLEADDWLRIVEKKLEITQCTDREKVLYASGILEGAAADWWDAYSSAHQDSDNITWQEFKDEFRSYHIPTSVIKHKKKEFLSLKQGKMSVIEYRDKFLQLSRYAPDEIVNDEKKQELFLDGLVVPVRYMLIVPTFSTFDELVNKALLVEDLRRKMDEKKRKFDGKKQIQATRNTRYRLVRQIEVQNYPAQQDGYVTSARISHNHPRQ